MPSGWIPVFPRDKREAFARRSCSNKKIEQDDDSKKSHPALVVTDRGRRKPDAHSLMVNRATRSLSPDVLKAILDLVDEFGAQFATDPPCQPTLARVAC
jgi:hypothetical protein